MNKEECIVKRDEGHSEEDSMGIRCWISDIKSYPVKGTEHVYRIRLEKMPASPS